MENVSDKEDEVKKEEVSPHQRNEKTAESSDEDSSDDSSEESSGTSILHNLHFG
jgi:hypothetical protein